MVERNQFGMALVMVVLITTLITWLCIRVSYGTHATTDLMASRLEYEQQMQLVQAMLNYAITFCTAHSVELDRMTATNSFELILGPCNIAAKNYEGNVLISKAADKYQVKACLNHQNKAVVSLACSLSLVTEERGKIKPIISTWKILAT